MMKPALSLTFAVICVTAASWPASSDGLLSAQPTVPGAWREGHEAPEAASPKAAEPVARPARPSFPERPRVAMLGVAWEGGAAPDAETRRSASAALAAAAAAGGAWAWVERGEVERAAEELGVSLAMAEDPAASLRVGRWLRADLAVRPRVIGDAAGGGRVRIEVLDLSRGDLVHAAEVALPAGGLDGGLEAAAGAVHAGLRAACDELRASAARPIVAPLFFRNTGKTDRIEPLGDRLTASLEAWAEGSGVRVLRFPAAAEGRAEAELALLGLAESDADAWMQVADFYVWGSFREVEPGAGEAGANAGKVELELTLWDMSQLRVHRDAGDAADLDGLCERAAAWLAEAVSRGPATQVWPAGQAQAAQQLAREADGLRRQVEQASTVDKAAPRSAWGKAMLAYRTHLLQVATFLEPGRSEGWRLLLQAYSDATRIEDDFEYARHMAYLDLRDRAVRLHGLGDFAHVDAPQLAYTLQSFTPGWGVVGGAPGGMREPWSAAVRERVIDRILGHAAAEREVRNDPRERATLHATRFCRLMLAVFDTSTESARDVQAVEAFWPLIKPEYARHIRSDPRRPFLAEVVGDDPIEERIHEALEEAGEADRVDELFYIGADEGLDAALPAAASAPTSGKPADAAAPYVPVLDPRPNAERLAKAVAEDLAAIHAPPPAELSRRIDALAAAGVPVELLPEPPDIGFGQGTDEIVARREVVRTEEHEWRLDIVPVGAPPPHEGYKHRPTVVGMGDRFPPPGWVDPRPNIAALTAIQAATDSLRLGDELWLTTQTQGVVRYHLRTGELRAFTTDDGLTSRGFDRFARGEGPPVVAKRGSAILSRFDPQAQRFVDVSLPTAVQDPRALAVLNDLMIFGGERPQLLDMRTGEPRAIEGVGVAAAKVEERADVAREERLAKLPPEVREAVERHRSGMAAGPASPFGATRPVAAPRPYVLAAGALWVAANDQVVRVARGDDGGVVERRWTLPLAGRFTPFADGDYVWLFEAAPPPTGAPDLMWQAEPMGWLLLWDTIEGRLAGAWRHRLQRCDVRPTPRGVELAFMEGGYAYHTLNRNGLERRLGLHPRDADPLALEGASLGGMTPLMRAAALGDADAVRAQLAAGAPVQEASGDGWTALWSAAAARRADIAGLLLDAGATAMERDGKTLFRDGQWPESVAVASGDLTVLDRLLAGARDPAERRRRLDLALFAAVRADRPELVEPLVQRGASTAAGALVPAGMPNPPTRQVTPLMLAVSLDFLDCVDALLRAGADANGAAPKPSPGRMHTRATETPLITAIAFRRAAMAERLLAAGADPLAPRGAMNVDFDRADMSPLERAIATRQPRLALRLLQAVESRGGAAGAPLQAQLIRHVTQNPAILAAMRRAGLDLHSVVDEEYGKRQTHDEGFRGKATLFTTAAAGNLVKGMQTLIDFGVDPRREIEGIREGDLAVIAAGAAGSFDAVRELMDMGFGINAVDHAGNTALIRAALRGADARRVRALLELGADPAIANRAGQTARDLVVDEEVASLLPARDGRLATALPPARFPSPWLASFQLARAAATGDTETARRLVASGVAIDFERGEGGRETALDVAIEHGRVEITRLILEADPKMRQPSERARFVVGAVYENQPAIVDLLLDVPKAVRVQMHVGPQADWALNNGQLRTGAWLKRIEAERERLEKE